LFFHLEGSYRLLAETFLILELLGLLFKEVIALRSFGELTIDELVFSGESLNVFGKLRDFCRFNVDDLDLVVNLLSEVLVLLSKELNFILAFEKSALEIIFLASDDSHLVLHVAELKDLLI